MYPEWFLRGISVHTILNHVHLAAALHRQVLDRFSASTCRNGITVGMVLLSEWYYCRNGITVGMVLLTGHVRGIISISGREINHIADYF